MGTLYVVATPIGNLEDVTLRALRVLKEVSLIAAEDTRTTRKLLQRYDIRTPLISYYEANRSMRIPYLLERLQQSDVALASEAGMPGISDPGRELVAAAAQAGIVVVPIPGPSAVTAALAISGFPSGEFLFLGYLPSRPPARRRALQQAVLEHRTLVLFEAPHRIQASLNDMATILGAERLVVVCRELTKLHEEVYRGTLAQALEHFQTPRGEFTLVVAGARPQRDKEKMEDVDVSEELRALKESGASATEAVKSVAGRHRLPRRHVYDLWVRLAGDETHDQ